MSDDGFGDFAGSAAEVRGLTVADVPDGILCALMCAETNRDNALGWRDLETDPARAEKLSAIAFHYQFDADAIRAEWQVWRKGL